MEAVIQKTEHFVRDLLGDDCTGHDWFHIERVRRNALYICEKENIGDRFIIEMAALLHDVPDEKLNSSKEEGERKLFEFLRSLEFEQNMRDQMIEIIGSISFKGGKKTELTSVEAKIVQDADRLDAIGAIGIARTFAFGGKKGQLIYSPDIQVREAMTEEEYRKGKSTSIHHFYEKLLKLKDLMNTETAKEIAEKRHQLMEIYLEEFFNEWNGQS
ncbi:HD domain-containing protein [Bacillus sp. DTU_2020_1000418_1_SI_GHA_SEK_038]|uniref:HD domain-containing protein n=1 Tax=Bacillus sp. DTU_2020_1000418_1_SI_GHA_SEK_038 TaxID=3077585 RepID=UPI0028EAC1E1|nr:HD domain-containing protein [Bacillus sp. DTU_2020_1000418_1_SI_GHA_SEK_038]WNS73930.1 HD domain-containing protein [Bacillus sp. DTU_2020_1000418_1_SI_GHA_SEK_038]